jgi:hypothetical protein
MKYLNKIFSIFIFLLTLSAYSQPDEYNMWDTMMVIKIANPNPSYKPVIGLGGGVMSYIGDVKNGETNIMIGNPALKANLSMFVDRKHYYRLNFIVNVGSVGLKNGMWNNTQIHDFKTNIFNLGLNVDYNFGHFINSKTIRPFVAAGFEFLNFQSQMDSLGADNIPYYEWSDGTYRNYRENQPLTNNFINFSSRDYIYESRIPGKYSQQGFAIPIDIGFDYILSNRATLRFATSYNLTSTDMIDGKSGKKGFLNNDKYLFTYVTFHYDLFSDPMVLKQELLALTFDDESAFDWDIIAADEDYDTYLDFYDRCPGTPIGVEVDTTGCPLDDDNDGVPNYLDKELNTSPGSFVDENGVTLSAETVIANLSDNAAISREDFWKMMKNMRVNKYAGLKNLQIPEKFKIVDINRDNYISFDELLRAIDMFFDFNSPFTSNEIYELNDYFFAQ